MQELIETVELPEVEVVTFSESDTYFEPVAAYCSSSYFSC